MTTQDAGAAVDIDAVLSQVAEDGYAMIRGALPPERIERLRAAADEVAPQAAKGEQVHQLGMVYLHPEFTALGTDPEFVPIMGKLLTPNIHIYHSHLDVHPPEAPAPNAWRWHEDGGRQTADIEARIMLSAKIGYFLSDVSSEGYGNLEVIPGSHRWTDPLPRTPGEKPKGAIEVLAEPGDAVVFDRRIWHGRSTNESDRTRYVLFFGYSPRWVTQREFATAEQLEQTTDPVRRQLLGAPDWDTCHVGRAELPVQQLLISQGLV